MHTGASVIGPTSARGFSFPDFVKRFTGPSSGGGSVTEGDDGLAVVLRGQFIFCPSLSFRRALLPPQPFDARWRQVLDLDLIARLVFDGHRIRGVPARAYRYRRHGASQTAAMTGSLDRFREEFSLYGEIATRAGELGWRRSEAVARRARIVRAHVLYRALGSAVQGKLTEARSTMSLLKDRATA